MANPVFDAKNQCRALLQAALEKCAAAGKLPEGEFPEYVVEIPGDTAHGDFAANAAMVSARVLLTLVRWQKSSRDRNLPFFASSMTASAAFSPIPSMLFKDGMIFPSITWKWVAWAR